MVSVQGILLKQQLRLLKPAARRSTIQDARLIQNIYGRMGVRANVNRVDIEPVEFDGFGTAWVHPKQAGPTGRAILYLHGGGYTAGHLEYALGFGSVLSAETGIPTLCAAYRLAPEYIFPAALEDALSAYRFLLDSGFSPAELSLAGESAGGGLVFALCLKLRSLGLPLPGRIAALSPWADLAMTGASYTVNRRRDPSLVRESLAYYARLYAKGALKNPFVSPLYGRLEGMPSSLIIAGADELLRDDSVRLAKKLKDSGCSCTLRIYEGMWHVFPIFSIPESKQALAEICAFLLKD